MGHAGHLFLEIGVQKNATLIILRKEAVFTSIFLKINVSCREIVIKNRLMIFFLLLLEIDFLQPKFLQTHPLVATMSIDDHVSQFSLGGARMTFGKQ